VQFDLVNSWTFRDLRNEIQGLSSACPVFKYFQGLEFRRKNLSTFKDFQGCVGTMYFSILGFLNISGTWKATNSPKVVNGDDGNLRAELPS